MGQEPLESLFNAGCEPDRPPSPATARGYAAVFNRWYRHACAQAGLDAESHYRTLVAQYAAPKLRGPFNVAARRRAGFSEAEIDYLLGAGAPV